MGFGKALQLAMIEHAKKLGCYQVRSFSFGSSSKNHALKTSLGLALHPVARGDDQRGCYFVLPLRSAAGFNERAEPEG